MEDSKRPVQVIDRREDDTQPVTAVISHRVRQHREHDYERWILGISAVARTFQGHCGVTFIKPEAGICKKYVTILKFDCYMHLNQWLESDERKLWLKNVRPLITQKERVQVLTGFETWFTIPNRSDRPTPLRYKMVVLTTFSVFSVARLLNILLQPLLSILPSLVSSLIATFLVVLVLTYLVMPRLTKIFYTWLYPNQ